MVVKQSLKILKAFPRKPYKFICAAFAVAVKVSTVR